MLELLSKNLRRGRLPDRIAAALLGVYLRLRRTDIPFSEFRPPAGTNYLSLVDDIGLGNRVSEEYLTTRAMTFEQKGLVELADATQRIIGFASAREGIDRIAQSEAVGQREEDHRRQLAVDKARPYLINFLLHYLDPKAQSQPIHLIEDVEGNRRSVMYEMTIREIFKVLGVDLTKDPELLELKEKEIADLFSELEKSADKVFSILSIRKEILKKDNFEGILSEHEAKLSRFFEFGIAGGHSRLDRRQFEIDARALRIERRKTALEDVYIERVTSVSPGQQGKELVRVVIGT
ncbi:hypothetical protein HY612_01090 [Candidatus Roizmanbacteria bacterium]|nr:hypothetical protein [Candidatus Roizmanbacteria bacterium]